MSSRLPEMVCSLYACRLSVVLSPVTALTGALDKASFEVVRPYSFSTFMLESPLSG